MWNTEALERLRLVGDPDADKAVRNLTVRGGIEEASLLLCTLIENDASIVSEEAHGLLPIEISAFLRQHSALPPWADEAKIKRGQDLFLRFGPHAVAALLCASLPECYSHEKGAKVLWYTQNLEEHTVRRVYQTAQIILEVMRPGGLARGGPGVRAAQKTRLLHAAMRHLILAKPCGDKPNPPRSLADHMAESTWDMSWGVPINQEDSIFTLLVFSYVILRSWQRLGVPVSPEDQEAYLHCWNVCGYFLGVDEDYLSHTVDDAERAYSALQAHQQAGSREGRDLTVALQSVIEKIVPDEKLAAHIDNVLMRYLVTERTAEALGLPPPNLMDRVVTFGLQTSRVFGEGASALGAIVREVTGGRKPPNLGFAGPENISARIGQTITELLVAVVGRDDGGFSWKRLGERAGAVVSASKEAGPPVTGELSAMFHAKASSFMNQDVMGMLGRHVMEALAGGDPSPKLHGTKLMNKRIYAMPPELAKAWKLRLPKLPDPPGGFRSRG